jgi:hypothetical protein
MSNSLEITNVINVSVSQPGAGIGAYNTSNVALFTRDTPGSTFGTLGYAIYSSPTQVGTDFGTSSQTYAMANAIFSQKPNILANGGYLVIIPFKTTAQPDIQTVSFPAIAASGTFVLNYSGNASAAINWNDTASQIQTKLQAVTGLSSATVTGSIASQSLVINTGIDSAAALMTVSSNSLLDSSSNAVTPTVATTQTGSSAETLDVAINRTQGLIQYFGVMAAEVPSQVVMLAAAAVIQAMNKIAFFVSYTSADVAPGGMLDLLRSGSYTQSRGLFYGDVLATALNFMAAYVGRALSVNFSGSNTTTSMHLKDLATIQPDPSMTQTLLSQCQAAGVDTYVNIQGVSKTFTSGKNSFFDRVYNQQWFVGAIQVAGFNALAQVSTKIPQTENGMNLLKAVYRLICQQAVANNYVAAGSWTLPQTFGVQEDFYNNISQVGFYIYSIPITQQSATDRASRVAPLVQIAIKEAGAIHSAGIIVNINQ